MPKRDWTLLAIAAAKGRPLTPVQLQKVLFLLGQEMPDEVGQAFYKFRPYNYGPFSAEIYTDADALAQKDFVEVARSAAGWAIFSATPEGMDRAAELRTKAPEVTMNYLDELVAWVRRLNFQQLVSAVYERYPEQRANSIFVDPAAR